MDLTQELGPRTKMVLGIVFAMVFAIPGGIVAFLGFSELYQGYMSSDWPTVEGEVLQASVASSDPGVRRQQRVYSPHITYSYRIGNDLYTADRVSFGDYSDSGSRYADRVLSRYDRGDPVTIHYEPGNPENAVLEPGIHGRTWFKPLLGVAFLAVGLLMAVFICRRFRKAA